MKIHKLDNFWGGWFVGNFEPAIIRSEDFEVCVKHFCKGDSEPVHFQRTSWEITAVVSGECRIGDVELGPGDIVLIEPLEPAGFVALTDCSIVAVKSPSLPSDKILGFPN